MEILYCDKDIIVVVKPRGVLSEEAGEGSLPALLKQEYGIVYPVHRLDRVVGGVMVYARHKRAAAALSAAVSANRLKKEYLAVLEGTPAAPEGALCDLLFKDSKQNKSFVVNTPRKGAKEARLTYRTEATAVAEGKTFTRVLVLLETGRSHQIRVQLASRGTPLVGDGKYGARTKAAAPALFAVRLTLPHPTSGREMTFEAPAPSDHPWSLFGAPHDEIEHKYLILMPDVAALAGMPQCRTLSMVQTYLTAPAGETHRVREVTEGDTVTYYETRKWRVSALSAKEEERTLSEVEYRTLLEKKDPTRTAVRKVRYALPYGARTLEIDVYPFWQDRAILEVEVASERETVDLPPFLRVLTEVTADKRYKNVNLAKIVPNDDISHYL